MWCDSDVNSLGKFTQDGPKRFQSFQFRPDDIRVSCSFTHHAPRVSLSMSNQIGLYYCADAVIVILASKRIE